MRSIVASGLAALAVVLGVAAAPVAQASTSPTASTARPGDLARPGFPAVPGFLARPAAVAQALAPEDVLPGVSCVRAGDCLAVGYDDTASLSAGAPISALWNGSAWRAVPVHLTAGVLGGQLPSVACEPTACVAVGEYQGAEGREYPLAATWNGRAWALVKLPLPAGSLNGYRVAGLNGVACWSASGCLATGSYYSFVAKTAVFGAFSETWNGHSWTAHDLPAVAGLNGELSSLTCLSATDCVAVGGYLPKGGHYTSLIESWNGSAWTRLAAPATTGHDVVLGSVSCASATSCVASGRAFTTQPSSEPRSIGITEILSGSTWRLVTPPWPSGRDSFPSVVTCPSPGRCLMVGATALHVNNDYRYPYAATWNGTAWTPVAVPAPPKAIAGSKDTWAAGLDAVTCVTATSCVVTGEEDAIHSFGLYGVAGSWTAGAWRLTDLVIR